MVTFGKRIAQLRKKKGLSKHEFASLCGMTVPMVINYEAGVTIPRVDNAAIMANVLGCTMDELCEHFINSCTDYRVDKLKKQAAKIAQKINAIKESSTS